MYQDRVAADPLVRRLSGRSIQLVSGIWGVAMRVLIAGDCGYIGPVVIRFLLAAEREVGG